MAEWPKAHAWKACRQKCLVGSNPTLSASDFVQLKMIKKKSIKIIFITVLIDLTGFGMIIPIIPFLARKFEADPLQVGFLLTSYFGMQFLLAPFWGKVSDRFGRRPVLLIGLMGTAFAYLWFAFSSHFEMLLGSRIFAGSFGSTISMAMAIVGDSTKTSKRSQGMGLIGAAFGLGFILGPSIGGLLLLFGENPVPFVAATLAFFNFIFVYFFLKESRLGVSYFSHKSELKSEPKISSDLGNSKQALRKKSVPFLFMVVFFIFALAMAHMETCLFLFVEDKLGWGVVEASFGFAYVGILMVLTQGYFLRKLLPFFGERVLLNIGLILGFIGFTGIGLSRNSVELALAMTFIGIGSALIQSTLRGLISLLSQKDQQGSSMGWLHSLSSLGRVIGPAVAGFFYRDIGPSFPFLIAGFLILLAFLLQYRIREQVSISGKN